ncbi:MAG: type II secretion system protein [Verrucomicrobia bacterium]|nr:type II secretion system protein [Verrucomicrobiota bacterium]
MKTFPLKQRAFTLIELMIIIVIVLVLVFVLIPNLATAKQRARNTQCLDNLKQVGLGFRLWPGDGDRYQMKVPVTQGGVMESIERGNVASVFLVMSNKLSTPKLLWCPAYRSSWVVATFTSGLGNSNVNYFVGIDASETEPQMFLVGDDNFLIEGQAVKAGVVALATNTPVAWSTTRHNKQGNIGLADGSVQSVSSAGLQAGLVATGTNIVRLAFP